MVDTPTASRELHCVVVTPERALLDEQADFIALPLYDGELGILPGRTPLIGRLGYGELRIRRAGVTQRFFIDSGFAQVRENVVTVLTSRAVKAEDIDPATVQRALEETHQPAPTPEAQEARLKAQERARSQLRVARHARGETGPRLAAGVRCSCQTISNREQAQVVVTPGLAFVPDRSDQATSFLSANCAGRDSKARVSSTASAIAGPLQVARSAS